MGIERVQHRVLDRWVVDGQLTVNQGQVLTEQSKHCGRQSPHLKTTEGSKVRDDTFEQVQ